MSKFLGKFRKNQNYSDDYLALKNNGSRTGRVNEHKEIKKVFYRNLKEELSEGYDYSDIEDAA